MTAPVHVMVDLETLGTGPDAAIVSIGVCAFDPQSDTVGRSKMWAVDIAGPETGVVDPATVLWWLRQSQQAVKDSFFSGPRVPIREAVNNLCHWLSSCQLSGDVVLWSRGPTFDETILRATAARLGIGFPVKFYNSRCVRTILDAAKSIGFAERKNPGVAHSALDDAIHQAFEVQRAYRWMRDRA